MAAAGLGGSGVGLGRAEMLGQAVAKPTSRLPTPSVALKFGPASAQLSKPSAESCSGFSRRQMVTGTAALVTAFPVLPNSAIAEKAPKGYNTVLDNIDGYTFVYPFGWQEVVVKGQDVAFKDVIEPLESVAVTIIKTDKSKLEELGSADQVARALVERVLASPSQKTQLLQATERTTEGRTYYTFEFTAKASNFTRHALGTVVISDGKFFTLTTGANERRWAKMQDKLKIVVDSFATLK